MPYASNIFLLNLSTFARSLNWNQFLLPAYLDSIRSIHIVVPQSQTPLKKRNINVLEEVYEQLPGLVNVDIDADLPKSLIIRSLLHGSQQHTTMRSSEAFIMDKLRKRDSSSIQYSFVRI